MFVAGFVFVLGGLAALAVVALLLFTDVGRAILAFLVLLFMLAVFAGMAMFGWPVLQSISRDEGAREIMHWLGGVMLVGIALWMIWTEISGRIEARRGGISYAAFIAEKSSDAPKYSPPRPWGPKVQR